MIYSCTICVIWLVVKETRLRDVLTESIQYHHLRIGYYLEQSSHLFVTLRSTRGKQECDYSSDESGRNEREVGHQATETYMGYSKLMLVSINLSA